MEHQAEPDDLAAHRIELLRYVHRLTGDADLAEDIAQDTLMRYLVLQDSRTLQSPRAWLHRVAANLVRDHGRHMEMRRRRAVPVDTDTAPAPDQELERGEAAARVRCALERLSPRDREMLILRQSGFDYHEIAEVVGVKVTSVATLMIRALNRFRASYTEEATCRTRQTKNS